MRASSFVAPFFFIASSLAQAVEEGVAPDVAAPEGCKTTVKGNFTIGVQNFFAPREKRETAQEVHKLPCAVVHSEILTLTAGCRWTALVHAGRWCPSRPEQSYRIDRGEPSIPI